ncbi:MAG: hypothetical protein WBR33_16255 [Pseudonocardiaceae bacterium]
MVTHRTQRRGKHAERQRGLHHIAATQPHPYRRGGQHPDLGQAGRLTQTSLSYHKQCPTAPGTYLIHERCDRGQHRLTFQRLPTIHRGRTPAGRGRHVQL